MSPEIAAQFSDWKTFSGQSLEDPTASARFDINANGFHGYIISVNGTFLIDPYAKNDLENYIVYYKESTGGDRDSFSCGLKNINKVSGFDLINSLEAV